MDVIEIARRHISRAEEIASHYEGCEEEHPMCAMSALVSLAEHLIGELMAADTRMDEMMSDTQEQMAKLQEKIASMQPKEET